jgi:hypothetical protein
VKAKVNFCWAKAGMAKPLANPARASSCLLSEILTNRVPDVITPKEVPKVV